MSSKIFYIYQLCLFENSEWAQLVDHLLPTLEIRSLNPVIGTFYLCADHYIENYI